MSDGANNQGGGQGGLLADPHHARADAALTRRAIKNRWPIKPTLLETVALKVEDMVNSDDKRVSSQGIRTAVEMNKQNIQIDQEEDKAERLDKGKPTEIVGTHKYIRGVDGEAL